MLSRVLPLLRSSSLRPLPLSIRRSLHKGVDSTPPLRFVPVGEKSLSTRPFSSSSSSPSSFPFLTPERVLVLMKEADVASLNSPDPRHKDGCIVLDARTGDKVAYASNQATPGMEKSISWAIDPTPKELIVTEEWGLSKYPYMVHAEQSALIEARRVHKGPKIVYTTLHPCNRCAKHIVAMGDVVKVVYMMDRLECDTYNAAQTILKKGGLIVEKAKDIPENVHLQEALEEAKKSPDTRTKVGCVVLCAETGKTLGTGYNRPSKGFTNDEIDWNASRPTVPVEWIDSKFPYVQHAGVMALMTARSNFDGPMIIILNNFPCHECALTMVIGEDVVKVIYRNPPKSVSQRAAVKILEKAGIEVEQFHLGLYLLIGVTFLAYPTSVLLRLNDLRPPVANELNSDVQDQINAIREAKRSKV